jgi:predicted ester cyclase
METIEPKAGEVTLLARSHEVDGALPRRHPDGRAALCVRVSSLGGSIMSIEENKDIVRRYYQEVMAEGRYDRLSAYVSEDFVEENPDLVAAGQQQGLDGLRRWMEGTEAFWGDVQWTIEDMVGEGETVALRATVEGTQIGKVMGVDPVPGRRVKGQACNVLRLRDGKIRSSWFLLDQFALLQQAGVLPESFEPLGYGDK